jgi:predicted nucleic acid-binding protein
VIVVADTTPLNYLILIEQVHVLPHLFGRVLIPPAVREELQQERTPPRVRDWMATPPTWLEVRSPHQPIEASLLELDKGEREALALAQELRADAVLLDDREAREEAARRHLTVFGTLRVLGDAAEQGLLDLPEAFARLQQTNFRVDTELLRGLLNHYRRGKTK